MQVEDVTKEEASSESRQQYLKYSMTKVVVKGSGRVVYDIAA